MNLKSKSTADLKTMQQNYLNKKLHSDPLYLAITSELGIRQSGVLRLDATVNFLREQARLRRFVSYGDVSDNQKIPWVVARRPMPLHLDAVCEFARGKDWPLLSSIVVNKENLTSGRLDEKAMAGFMKAARRLGYDPLDEDRFLRDQQEEVFIWAATGATA